MTRRSALAALASVLVVLAGCGGGGRGDPGAEAGEVFAELQSLRPGEILIKGFRAPRLSGSYEFRPGGYVMTYRQTGTDGRAPRLTVALESQPNSRRKPHELVVDTSRLGGRAIVHVSGELYVNVRSAGPPFVLRFTPNRT